MNNRIILLLCVLTAIVATALLVNAAPTPQPPVFQICVDDEETCIGTVQYECLGNQWLFKEMNSFDCGYGSPTTAVRKVLSAELSRVDHPGFDGWAGDGANIDLGTPKTVTLYSGGVSGGSATLVGGVPGSATVKLCDEMGGGGSCNDFVIALPLYSEVTFENVRFILLQITVPHAQTDPVVYNVEANVVYSVS